MIMHQELEDRLRVANRVSEGYGYAEAEIIGKKPAISLATESAVVSDRNMKANPCAGWNGRG